MALLTGGLVQVAQVNGVGVCTNGLVWQANEIWFDPQSVYGVSTGWLPALGYSGSAMALSTAWAPAIGYSGNPTLVISTSWTASQSFGDESPS